MGVTEAGERGRIQSRRSAITEGADDGIVASTPSPGRLAWPV